jgi:dTMP kinase
MSPPTGALIVLEGAEGVGKSTQLALLAARLRGAGERVIAVREPGSTPLGDGIRHLLLDPELHIAPRAEALLFMAARAQLVDDVIRPAISGGTVVLADRFFLSTYAYQSFGRGLDDAQVRALNGFATGGLVPDVTVLLDLPDGEGLARATARGPADRIERSGDDFHGRVAAAFRAFAQPGWQERHPECGPIVRVDASGTQDEVAARIWQEVEARRHETFPANRGSQ